MDITIDIRDVVAFAQRSANAPQIIREEIEAALTKSGFAVEGKAKELAPYNYGALRDSIVPQMRYPQMVVSAQKNDYAPVMEFGRSPNSTMPPDAPIRDWLQRKRKLTGDERTDDGIVYRKRLAIAKYGIKGRFYMRGSFEYNMPRIRSFFELAGMNIRRRALAE